MYVWYRLKLLLETSLYDFYIVKSHPPSPFPFCLDRILFWKLKMSQVKVRRVWWWQHLWNFLFGQEMLQILRRERCWDVVVDLLIPWRPIFLLLEAYCVAEGRRRICKQLSLFALWFTAQFSSEKTANNTFVLLRTCRAFFSNRWLGLRLAIVASSSTSYPGCW